MEDLSHIWNTPDINEAFEKFKRTKSFRNFEENLEKWLKSDPKLKQLSDSWEGPRLTFDEMGEPVFLGLNAHEISVRMRDVFRYGKHFPKGSVLIGSKNPFTQVNSALNDLQGEFSDTFIR